MPSVPRKYLHKRSNTPGHVPALSALDEGLIAINTYDGSLFTKVIQNSAESLAEYIPKNQLPYTLDFSLSSINSTQGGNNNTGVFSNILGGFGNNVTGSGSSILGGESNQVAGDFSMSFGLNNQSSLDYTIMLGSGLSASEANYTYVNNLSSQGYVEANDFVGDNLYALNAGIVFTQTNTVSSINSQTYSLTAVNIVADNVNVTGQSLSANDIYVSDLYATNLHGNGSGITNLNKNQIDINVNTKTDSFTLALSDYHTFIRINTGNSGTISIPPNSAVPLKVNTQIKFFQVLHGPFTFSAPTGVTLLTKNSNQITLHGIGYIAELIKTGTDEWFLTGDLSTN